MALDMGRGAPRIVLVGYSKGINDLLDAVVTYPEIRSRVAAVVSTAGSVGGSPLAEDSKQYQANLFEHFPKASCDAGDGGGVESLRPQVRKAWLAEHPLPGDMHYYSLVTFPHPDRISSILRRSYNKLSSVDGRNDSQVIFYDEIIPIQYWSGTSMPTIGPLRCPLPGLRARLGRFSSRRTPIRAKR